MIPNLSQQRWLRNRAGEYASPGNAHIKPGCCGTVDDGECVVYVSRLRPGLRQALSRHTAATTHAILLQRIQPVILLLWRV
jgi:hypothetical protein